MIDLTKLWQSMPRDVQKKTSMHDLRRTVDEYNKFYWKPIDTAPKDGTVFIAFCPHSQIGFQFMACVNTQGDIVCMMSGEKFKATHWAHQPPYPNTRKFYPCRECGMMGLDLPNTICPICGGE